MCSLTSKMEEMKLGEGQHRYDGGRSDLASVVASDKGIAAVLQRFMMDSDSDSDFNSDDSSSDISDREWELAELAVMEVVDIYYKKYFCKVPYHNDPFSGKEYVASVLEGNNARCPDMFRMRKSVLHDFVEELRTRGLLEDTRYVSIEEQLCIFLYIMGHDDSIRVVADRFQHSLETISRHFATVLKAICRFSKELICPPDFTTRHPYIMSKGDKYYPWFQNCVGAIDGTHVHAVVPSGKKQISYRGRKTIPTQNVMCVCDFNMMFTFVLAGWEGTTNDSRVFSEALSNPQLKFPHPPEGKFYLVDSGYPNKTGYLAPYKGDRYHISEYSGRNRGPELQKRSLTIHILPCAMLLKELLEC